MKLANLAMVLCFAGVVFPTTSVGAQETADFRRYEDVSGFACNFPVGWRFRLGKNDDRIFDEENDPSPDSTIIIQVIDRAVAKPASAEGQLAEIEAQLANAPEGQILAKAMASFPGQDAPYLVASYTVPDTSGKTRPFKHIQAVVTGQKYFYLLSFSAPVDEFAENVKVFENCAATMELTQP
jgi:hypothetical protein